MQNSARCYEKTKNGTYIKVKVIAKSSRNEVCGIIGDRIKISVRATPQNGEANAAVIDVIATFFSIKKSYCTITAGYSTSKKTIFITTDVEDEIKRAFQL